jgi:multimeric flavodoxin WrbA
MIKVVGIAGSSRENSNSERLLRMALDILSKEGIEVELITLHDKRINPCIYDACKAACARRYTGPEVGWGHFECIQKDDAAEIFKKLREADGLIIACPVYFSGVPGKLRALLERVGMMAEAREGYKFVAEKLGLKMPPIPTDPKKLEDWKYGALRHKVAAAIVTTRRTGANFVLAELLLWFTIMNMFIVGSVYWPIAIGGALASRDIEKDEEGVHTIKVLAENMVWLLKKIKEKKE